MSVPQRRKAVRHYISLDGISERRACALIGLSRTTCRYKPRSEPQEALRQRIVEIARTRVRYGYRRIHVLLKREGIQVNKKTSASLALSRGTPVTRETAATQRKLRPSKT